MPVKLCYKTIYPVQIYFTILKKSAILKAGSIMLAMCAEWSVLVIKLWLAGVLPEAVIAVHRLH